MRLPSVIHILTILFLLSTKSNTSPIPWPEEKLEAINYLRAKGASEVRNECLVTDFHLSLFSRFISIALFIWDCVSIRNLPSIEFLFSPHHDIDMLQEEIATMFPRPLIAPGPPSMHISKYPTTHSTDSVGFGFGLDATTSKDYLSKQRRLTQIVGQRDQDLRRAAQQRHAASKGHR